ncbi:MAG: tetratricopeptide repeat protein [Crocosphaera sp.]|nr:tetratricopeptide repeat protein [Crocosphaera sp.]
MTKYKTYFLLLFSVIIPICISCKNKIPSPSVESSPIIVSSPTPTIKPVSPEDKKKAASFREMGLNYRQQGQIQKAINALEASVSLDPQNLSGLVILGWTYHLNKQGDMAKKTLQNALKVDNNHIPALNALGIVYLVNNDLEKAVETHNKAINLKPDNEIAHYNLSLAYHRLQQTSQAELHGKQATLLEPNNPHPWVALALVYQQKNDLDLAKRTYQKAIALDSRYRQINFLNHLEMAGFSTEQIEETKNLLTNL